MTKLDVKLTGHPTSPLHEAHIYVNNIKLFSGGPETINDLQHLSENISQLLEKLDKYITANTTRGIQHAK